MSSLRLINLASAVAGSLLVAGCGGGADYEDPAAVIQALNEGGFSCEPLDEPIPNDSMFEAGQGCWHTGEKGEGPAIAFTFQDQEQMDGAEDELTKDGGVLVSGDLWSILVFEQHEGLVADAMEVS